MTISLPFEIWREIASYLPEYLFRSRTSRFYTINRAFFEIYMEKQYGLVSFASSWDIGKNLKYLLHQIPLEHVQSLYLDPHLVSRLHNDYLGGNRIFKKIRLKYDMHRMQRIIQGLSKLTSLEILSKDCMDYPDLISAVPLIKAVFSASFSTLRSLTLDMLDSCSSTLTPKTVFPNLTSLRIRLPIPYRTTPTPPIISELVTPFINNHYASLQAFYLSSSSKSNYTYDISSFLLKLRHFPQLEIFGLSHEFVNAYHSQSAGLTHVLELHAVQLKELSLHITGRTTHSRVVYPGVDEWYAQDYLQVRLPNLEVLDLWTELYPDIFRTSKYLFGFHDTLVSLRLSNVLTYPEIENVVDVFTPNNKLRKLHLSVMVLTPELLVLLAKKLPSLETLHLRFHSVTSMWSHLGGGRSVLTLQLWNSANWKLHHLVAEPDHPHFITYLEAAIRRALPDVRTIDII